MFRIEWANAGMCEEISDGDKLDFVNIQVRLFEANGVVEFHYGPSLDEDATLFDPTIAGLIHIAFDPFSYAGNVYALDGIPTSPPSFPTPVWTSGTMAPISPSRRWDGGYTVGGPRSHLDVSEAEEGLLRRPINPTLDQVRIDFAGLYLDTHRTLVREVMAENRRRRAVARPRTGQAGVHVFRLDDGRVERLVRH